MELQEEPHHLGDAAPAPAPAPGGLSKLSQIFTTLCTFLIQFYTKFAEITGKQLPCS
jgi:hypothetical protein